MDINAKISDDYPPLHLAIKNKLDKEIIELLIHKGADVNAKIYDDDTPLHLAIKNKLDKKTIELLILQGADINAKNKCN